jgi:signal transduction histidine kinase
LRALLETRRFCVQDSARPLHAICDPGLLSRVLSNLIGNAIAFTAPQEGKICIRFQPEAGRVRVEVVDNGPGIDPVEQQIIFEKFRQGREHVRDRSSGLGLAFCKLAMEAQHGTIGVDSQPGVGSKFWFEVPGPP